jgi:hypothetical protein
MVHYYVSIDEGLLPGNRFSGFPVVCLLPWFPYWMIFPAVLPCSLCLPPNSWFLSEYALHGVRCWGLMPSVPCRGNMPGVPFVVSGAVVRCGDSSSGGILRLTVRCRRNSAGCYQTVVAWKGTCPSVPSRIPLPGSSAVSPMSSVQCRLYLVGGPVPEFPCGEFLSCLLPVTPTGFLLPGPLSLSLVTGEPWRVYFAGD